jgi:hypothetical protein
MVLFFFIVGERFENVDKGITNTVVGFSKTAVQVTKNFTVRIKVL